jgi:SAM-dependent methyltransferase
VNQSLEPTERFSSRAVNYAKYRPGYPPVIIDLLRRECELTSESVVADAGSGTGILTELLLTNGGPVFAVEPNREMRLEAENRLDERPNFHSVNARAEETTLPPGRIDLITAGQAFHWFDPEKTRREFLRILRPGGWAALIWNERGTRPGSFLEAYDALLVKYALGYQGADHRHAERVGPFFGPAGLRQAIFPNPQNLGFDELKGRLLSSSYAPEPGHPNHAPMLKALEEMFNRHQSNGTVAADYQTLVFYGRLA